jgi:hypothetical protein
VSNPPPPEDFSGRAAAIAGACDVPAHMLTEWRQREAMRRFKFFPSVAEVQEWLAPDLKDERETQRLRLARPEPEHERGPRSLEEIAAVRAKAAEARRVLLPDTAPQQRAPVKPLYLTPAQLLPELDRLAKQGNAIAATRAAHIRKQLAAAS